MAAQAQKAARARWDRKAAQTKAESIEPSPAASAEPEQAPRGLFARLAQVAEWRAPHKGPMPLESSAQDARGENDPPELACEIGVDRDDRDNSTFSGRHPLPPPPHACPRVTTGDACTSPPLDVAASPPEDFYPSPEQKSAAPAPKGPLLRRVCMQCGEKVSGPADLLYERQQAHRAVCRFAARWNETPESMQWRKTP